MLGKLGSFNKYNNYFCINFNYSILMIPNYYPMIDLNTIINNLSFFAMMMLIESTDLLVIFLSLELQAFCYILFRYE